MGEVCHKLDPDEDDYTQVWYDKKNYVRGHKTKKPGKPKIRVAKPMKIKTRSPLSKAGRRR